MTSRRSLVGLLLLFALWGGIYSVVVPLFEAPDEVWHVSFVRYLVVERALPVQPVEGKDMWLRESGQPPLYHLVTAVLLSPFSFADFPDWVRFNPDHPFVSPNSTSDANNLFIHTQQEAFPYQGTMLAIHLGRLITVLWGVGTLVGVYAIARLAWPERPGWALGVTAVSAFNPHFIFIHSIVNNDAAIACLATWTLYLTIRLGQGKSTRRSELALGVVLGLALLSKLSALALPVLVLGGMGWRWWGDGQWRPLFRSGWRIFPLALLIAGWWYGRNWLLYGDPLAWKVWLVDIGEHHLTLPQLLAQFRDVGFTFWEPYVGVLPWGVWLALGGLLALSLGGWLKGILTLLRRPSGAALGIDKSAMLLAGGWFLLLFASLVRYMLTTPAAAGRLLYPGTAVISLYLVWGLALLWPKRANLLIGVLGVGVLGLGMITPWLFIRPLFPPAVIPLADVPQLIPVSGESLPAGWQLLGVQVEPETVVAGETVTLTLYWQVRQAVPADLRLILRLWTPTGRVLHQWDRPPAYESYPPDLWQAGDVVRDVYRVRVPLGGEWSTAVYRLTADLSAGGQPLAALATATRFRWVTPVDLGEVSQRLDYALGETVRLVGYRWGEVTPDGAFRPLVLYWQATGTMTEDYQVFVHLLIATGELVAQVDGAPMQGDYPTSWWQVGEVLADEHLIPVAAVGENGRVRLGLYRLTDGQRLPITTGDGQRLLDDALELP